MNFFLNPIALSFAALSGLIVLMYLLKLKRKQESFSSTMLWNRVLEDLTANAPFQKLRQNPLMYLQILALLLLVMALARPTLFLERADGFSRIVMIDNTASMNATDGTAGPTRLDTAKSIARGLVDNMKTGDEMMLISFGTRARVHRAFTTEKSVLRASIDAIEATDGGSEVDQAFRLAQGVRKVAPNAAISVVSDGGVGYLGNLIGEDDAVEYHPVGISNENLGIVAFDVRESFERPGEAELFAEIENFGFTKATVMVRCLIDDELVQVQETEIDGAGRQGFTFGGLSGEKSLAKVEIVDDDSLPADNVAYGMIELDTTFNVLLVSSSNYFLERMLTLIPGSQVSVIPPSKYDPTITYDLVVFDQFTPEDIGPGRYLFLNAAPPMDGFEVADVPLETQMAIDWHRLHPVTRYVSFEDLVAGQSLDFSAPDWTTSLVESSDADLIVAGQRHGIKLVMIGFDLYASDWPLQMSFPIFFSNAIRWLRSAGESDSAPKRHCGDTLAVNSQGTEPVNFINPAGQVFELKPDDESMVYFNETWRAGMYQAEQDGNIIGRFAVNVLNPDESKIAPATELISGEQQIVARQFDKENREVWPWFAIAALCALTIEWHWYCRRSWL